MTCDYSDSYFSEFPLLVVAGEGRLPSTDVLNDSNGRGPCEMRSKYLNDCTVKRRDDTDTKDTPITPCTCTNLYFNLWSACIFVQNHLDNTTLPSCEALVQNCTREAHTIVNWNKTADWGYPGWVFAKIPSNGTFDIAAAIEASTPPSHKWTIIQIVVPILAGLTVAVILLVIFIIYRRRKRANKNRPWMQTTGNRARFNFPSLSQAVKVRELDRSESWSIEEAEEPLQEYQFVSYPNSLQGSHASGHVRLSSSSSGTHPPPLSITTGKAVPARASPGRGLWYGVSSQTRRLLDSVPFPWRAAKRVHVKNVGSYGRFRVDAADSDSPLSRRNHEGVVGRNESNLRNETIFEQDNSDDEAEGLLLMPQQPPQNAAANAPYEDPFSPHTAARPRQIPPSSSPPRIPLPLPPPQPSPQPAPKSASKSNRSVPTFPPAPTSPPPPPPPINRSSPRAQRGVLPSTRPPPLPLSTSHERSDSASIRSLPRQPHARTNSDSSSIRSLPMTPTPPYARGTSQQQQQQQPVASPGSDSTFTPPNSAPPYVQRPSLDLSHSPRVPSRPLPSANSSSERTMRRLPRPPG
ncbi:hypothetical protein MIND_00254400 [Mycena indigotica]|uniref:Uncharacterized protein n=1 Tax=Mycena indigotica TaxID=2126181 RepID=A0A8H6T5E8_9AGAR|nr:uncharacterized protein MIND_00254400 [Mycena indigotica]KAF7312410.1 hypothetical protein MIND_00254400 [Mycena indigotica]